MSFTVSHGLLGNSAETKALDLVHIECRERGVIYGVALGLANSILIVLLFFLLYLKFNLKIFNIIYDPFLLLLKHKLITFFPRQMSPYTVKKLLLTHLHSVGQGGCHSTVE